MLLSEAMDDMTKFIFPGTLEFLPLSQTLLSSLVPDLRAGFGGRWVGVHMAGRKGTSFHLMRFPQLMTTDPCLKIYCCKNQSYQLMTLSTHNAQCCVFSFCLYYDKTNFAWCRT